MIKQANQPEEKMAKQNAQTVTQNSTYQQTQKKAKF